MYEIKANIKSINEYLDFLDKYKTDKKGSELWYRGQRDNSWLLEASLYRDKKRKEPQPKTGGSVRLKYDNFLDFHKEMNQFTKLVKEKLPKNFNKFHIMMLGQHYGLKTPALDWSTDPLVAMFFAINEFEGDSDKYPVIFVLDPSFLNENSCIAVNGKNITKPLIIDDIQGADTIFDEWLMDSNNTPFSEVPFAIKSELAISHRISRQSGVFTLMDARQPLSYPWIQTSIHNRPIGITMKISPSCIGTIKRQLDILSISQKTLYGTDYKEWEDACSKAIKRTPKI